MVKDQVRISRTEMNQLKRLEDRREMAGVPMLIGIIDIVSGYILELRGDVEKLTGYDRVRFLGKPYTTLCQKTTKPKLLFNSLDKGEMHRYKLQSNGGEELDMCMLTIQKNDKRAYFISLLMGKSNKES